MNALDMKLTRPARAIVMGAPGSGKSGALVALAEAGFNIRILDYDGNPDPILQFASDEALKRIDIVRMADKFRDGPDGIDPLGIPTAFTDGIKMLKHWKYGPPGAEVDLGKPEEWGLDTVLVLDGFKKFGEAAYRRAMVKSNKTRKTSTWRVWQFAQIDVDRAVDIMASDVNHYNLVILAHPKEIGPKLPEEDDDPEVRDIKMRMAALVPTKQHPAAPGVALAPTIGGSVPMVLKAEVQQFQGKDRRVFTADPTINADLKFPGRGIKWPIRAEVGLLEVFRALGIPAPLGYPPKASENKS